jgi:hypothetical protein
MLEPKLNVLYQKTFSPEITVKIGQVVAEKYPNSEIARSSYLVMVIVDTTTNTYISFHLKVFRKIIMWMFNKGFTDKPRRLGFFEKLKLNKNLNNIYPNLKNNKILNKKKEKEARLKEEIDYQQHLLNQKDSEKEKTLDIINKLQKRLNKL